MHVSQLIYNNVFCLSSLKSTSPSSCPLCVFVHSLNSLGASTVQRMQTLSRLWGDQKSERGLSACGQPLKFGSSYQTWWRAPLVMLRWLTSLCITMGSKSKAMLLQNRYFCSSCVDLAQGMKMNMHRMIMVYYISVTDDFKVT